MFIKALITSAAVLICCVGDPLPSKAQSALPYAKDCPTFLSNLKVTMERINAAGVGGSTELTAVQKATMKEAAAECNPSYF